MDANGNLYNSPHRLNSFNPRARDGREVFIIFCIKRLSSFNPRARDGRELLAPK